MPASTTSLPHLFLKTLILVLNCINLVFQFQSIVMDLLDRDAVIMERWDPSEIITAPFPIDTLRCLVRNSFLSGIAISALLSLLQNHEQHYTRRRNSTTNTNTTASFAQITTAQNALRSAASSALFQITLAIIILFFAIFMGASPNQEHVGHTFWASVYMSSTAFSYVQPIILVQNKNPYQKNDYYPTFLYQYLVTSARVLMDTIAHIVLGPREGGVVRETSYATIKSKSKGSSESLHETMEVNNDNDNEILVEQDDDYKKAEKTALQELPNNPLDRINQCILYSTLLVSIPFMILNILDHGGQMQRWPVPMLLSATIGHSTGVGLGVILTWISVFWKGVDHRKIY